MSLASFYFLLAILRNNSHPVRSTHSEREFESIHRVVQPSTTIWFQDVFVLPLPLTLYSSPLASLNSEHFCCFPFTSMMFNKRLLMWGLSAMLCDAFSTTTAYLMLCLSRGTQGETRGVHLSLRADRLATVLCDGRTIQLHRGCRSRGKSG